MNIRKCIKERRSIRKFKADKIPHIIIQEILEDARWTPSWGNTQPWELYILIGKQLEEFKSANCQKFLDRETSNPDIMMPESWPDIMKERYIDSGKSVLASLSIAKDNKKGRERYYCEMYSLFDAPCLIVVCIDKSLAPEYAMFDTGAIVQTICLLAHERGIGSCIMASAVRYPELMREFLGIREGKLIVVGIALGYPDYNTPVNFFERKRAEMNELIKWGNSL